MPKYMLIVNFEGGVVDTPMEEWKPEEIDGAPGLLPRAAQGARRETASWSSPRRSPGPTWRRSSPPTGTAPVVTDGPFQEFKEWLAGYQIVDVESEERAIEIAARLSAVPGPDGVALQQPIHVRQVMEERRRTPPRWRLPRARGGER